MIPLNLPIWQQTAPGAEPQLCPANRPARDGQPECRSAFPATCRAGRRYRGGYYKSPVQGQIFELADANALYMREGDKIARIRTVMGSR